MHKWRLLQYLISVILMTKMSEIKKVAEEIRSRNGFSGDETTKDLLFYLISRVDDTRLKVHTITEKVIKNDVSVKYLKWSFGIIIVVLVMILGKLIV